jgi:hypothetical protein
MADKTNQITERLKQIEKRLAALEAQLKKPKGAAKAPAIKRGMLIDQIIALREDGFFDSPRTITEVKIKLAERGYSSPVTTLSPLLLRSVREGQLKRELTTDGFKYEKH